MYPIFPRFHSGLSTNTFSRDCLQLDAMIIKMRTSDKETSHVSRRSTVHFSDNTHRHFPNSKTTYGNHAPKNIAR